MGKIEINRVGFGGKFMVWKGLYGEIIGGRGGGYGFKGGKTGVNLRFYYVKRGLKEVKMG